jgi:hypothetical protein
MMAIHRIPMWLSIAGILYNIYNTLGIFGDDYPESVKQKEWLLH